MTWASDANVRALAAAIATDVRGIKGRLSAVEEGGPLDSLPWTSLTDVPVAFPASPHGHSIADIGGLQSALDERPVSFRTINGQSVVGSGDIAISGGGSTAWGDISGKPATFPPAVHSHAWTEITGKPSAFTPAAHSHAIADVTGLQGALDGKAPTSHTHAWADVTGKPATFAPSTHTHAWADVTGKPSTFAPSAHSHAITDVTGLQSALDGKLPATALVGLTTIRRLTQAQYDALTPDPNTFYVVVG